MQPDFSALFRVSTIRPLRFEVRNGPNYVHDVQFLSSHLHDARFTIEDVTLEDGKLSIVFDRDCWELGYTKHPDSLELHTASSRLTIEPVSGIDWVFTNEDCRKRELWVENIHIGEMHWDKNAVSELIVGAPHTGWKLRIAIADDIASIQLADLEMPHLHDSNRV